MKRVFLFVIVALVGTMMLSCANNNPQPQNDSQETSNECKEFETKAIARLQEFYSNYIFAENFSFGDPAESAKILGNYCTETLVRRLADDYDYEGEGFAFWNFYKSRYNNDSMVYGVERIEPFGNGWFRVDFLSKGGYDDGCSLVYVVKEGDKILFDNLAWMLPF